MARQQSKIRITIDSHTTFEAADIAKAAPSRSPFLVITSLALGGFAIGTTEFAAMAMLPYFSSEYGITESDAARAISSYALGVVIGAPLLAVLGSKLSQKRLLIALMCAFAVFNTLSALAPNFDLFVMSRFFSGLPHGAYFGVAALVAAAQVDASKRSRAMSYVFLGLTTATIVGVPAANILGQSIGWRWGFASVGVFSTITALAVCWLVPAGAASKAASFKRELMALRNRQVLLTLATGAIGFGGFFAVYTYVASTMTSEMQTNGNMIPLALSAIGTGMMAGTLLSGWAADKSRTIAGFGFMAATTLVLLLYPASTYSLWTYIPALFLMGTGVGLANVLQSRLMDVAGEAQQLAAALNHSAFNVANALGPFFAAMVIANGFSFSSSGYVGAALTVAGIMIFSLTVWDAAGSH